MLHECTDIAPERLLADYPSLDLEAPVSDYRAGYRPGAAVRNAVAGMVYDLMARATSERRDLTLAEARIAAQLAGALSATYDAAWRASLGEDAEP